MRNQYQHNWVTDPSGITEPITLDEAKAHLRITNDDEDDVIEAAITDARDWCEQYLSLAIPEQTITAFFDCWPDDDHIDLPFSNLLSVTSVKYLDSSGSQQTLGTNVYGVDSSHTPGRIYLKASQVWPEPIAEQHNAIEIKYQAGFYASTTGVQDAPPAVKRAIKLLMGHWYENRESSIVGMSIAELPLGVTACLDRYRKYGV